MKSIYLNDWAESKKQGMMRDFNITEKDLLNSHILLASYNYEQYKGDAFVLLEKEGKLYEVSYYSGDDITQWELEETSIESLEKRLASGYFGMYGDRNTFKEELIEILKKLKKRNARSEKDKAIPKCLKCNNCLPLERKDRFCLDCSFEALGPLDPEQKTHFFSFIDLDAEPKVVLKFDREGCEIYGERIADNGKIYAELLKFLEKHNQ